MVFDWKIWAKKLAKNIVVIAIAGAAVVYSDNPYWLALAPTILAIENAVKHW